ncbi:hypothetical protein P3L10_030051 [Capsicum annuum]
MFFPSIRQLPRLNQWFQASPPPNRHSSLKSAKKEGVTIEVLRYKHRNDPEKIVEIMKKKGLTKTSSPTKFQKSVKRKKSDEKGECSKIASPVASDSESEQEKVEKVWYIRKSCC